jgi:hypothetical protein
VPAIEKEIQETFEAVYDINPLQTIEIILALFGVNFKILPAKFQPKTNVRHLKYNHFIL